MILENKTKLINIDNLVERLDIIGDFQLRFNLL